MKMNEVIPQIPKGTGIDTGAGSGISGGIYTGGQ